ncbi:protein deglycase YajL [Gilliamella sp. Pra-s65]|uniref:protein deglycase YajL n=1 Tax=unclassified Gilliamella TaxID=2685620 RepID=UPI0013656DFC|nr:MULTISPECIES: protein deglycase YajL [unclassified Gilliamella]MWN90404.1 protein deglycase YajL [Gilliamella sp. Pra-s65]MWP47736.1 protein deglycase YajL [Gilliamella sp. Pas-s27]MWP73497.1 protein deglycase YajL [Gilliamella sp. Pra-s52]
MTKQALVFLSDGCEEIEAVTTIDLLTRAGINVTTASISSSREVECSRGVKILAKKTLSDVQHVDFKVVILPGGLKGAENFRDCPLLIEKLKQIHQTSGIVAAICASPAIVLQHHNLFPNANMTGYPTTKEAFKNWKADRVYFDEQNKVLTSQGPATSIDFALKIIEVLLGRAKAAEVASQLILPSGIETYQ